MSKREYWTFIATGETYNHRETLASWAWHWDKIRSAWIEDNHSQPDDRCILAIKELPGVRVQSIKTTEESFL